MLNIQQKGVDMSILLFLGLELFPDIRYNSSMQIWFIGRMLASQAGEGGSIPLICSSAVFLWKPLFNFKKNKKSLLSMTFLIVQQIRNANL